jgi:hypothetical protein
VREGRCRIVVLEQQRGDCQMDGRLGWQQLERGAQELECTSALAALECHCAGTIVQLDPLAERLQWYGGVAVHE